MGVATNLLTCFLYRADKNRTFEDMYVLHVRIFSVKFFFFVEFSKLVEPY